MIALCTLASRALAQSDPIALDTRACPGVDTVELRRILALERPLVAAQPSSTRERRADESERADSSSTREQAHIRDRPDSPSAPERGDTRERPADEHERADPPSTRERADTREPAGSPAARGQTDTRARADSPSASERAADGRWPLQVVLRCEGDRAWMRAGSVTRELALGSVPAALRPRLLALAIAELRAPEAKPVVVAAPQRFRLSIAAHGQLSSLAAAGAELGFSAQLRPWLAWASGAAITQGKLAIDHGELRLRHASAFIGPALQREIARVTLAAGAGVRAGWLGLRGLPREREVRSQRFDTWFVGPTVFGSGALRFARHGFALLSLALTHTLREVHAEVRGGRTRTLSPWLASASLGVGASW